MKKIIILIIIALSITSVLFAQKTPFEKFNKNKIDIGTMYVYEYSTDEKGFEPSYKAFFYVKTLNEIEVIWTSVNEDTLENSEKFKMNWDYMMFENFNWYWYSQIFTKILEYSKYSIDFTKKTIKAKEKLQAKNNSGFKMRNLIWKFKSIPTYFYIHTDLQPLWFALRFYPFNRKMIIVNSVTNGYNIKLEIKYEGKEKVKVPFGKVLCYKFELIPKLSFLMKLFHSPKKAFIWLTSEDTSRYMVKYKNNNVQNSETPLLEYRLMKREKMTSKEWEQFKEKHGAKDTNSTN